MYARSLGYDYMNASICRAAMSWCNYVQSTVQRCPDSIQLARNKIHGNVTDEVKARTLNHSAEHWIQRCYYYTQDHVRNWNKYISTADIDGFAWNTFLESWHGQCLTRKFCHFYIIFHSIVQRNMKQKFVSRLSSSPTIKQYIQWLSWV